MQLPERYLITGAFDSLEEFSRRLSNAIDNGIQLVQLRLKSDWLQNNSLLAKQVLHAAEVQCKQANITLLLNVPEALRALGECKNIHADSTQLHNLQTRPDCELLSVSCHTVSDLEKAVLLNADFAVLSPVQKTQSHPDAEPLGWEKFQSMIDAVGMPIYALGGVGENELAKAQKHGAQGVAAIGAFWN